MEFPKLSEAKLIERLSYPTQKVRIVMDTDTFNEVDDQFAVTYALQSLEKMQIEAFYAAPFHNHLSDGPKDGMEKSYKELSKILKIMKRDDIPTYKGSETYLRDGNTPVESDAARDLVKRALASPEDDPLYVVAIGAITNVASAILMEPKIIEKMVVIWLGGHAIHWPDTREFNLFQDLHSSRTVLDCGVPLIHIPCNGVVSHVTTTLPELRENVKDKGEVGEYLYGILENYQDEKLKKSNGSVAYSKIIWDIAAVGYLVNPDWLPNSLIHSPILSEDFRWSFDNNRHFIRYIQHVDRDKLFGDLFAKLEG